MMPSGPIACAPTTRPHECASSTAASSSSCVNAVKSWVIPGVSTPPVATSLIAVAPARISSRTARRSASGPSTSRANPTLWPWPPVIVSARPAARILGPAMRPRSTPSATWITESPRPPRSRTVVTPCSSVRAALRTALTVATASVVISRDSPAKSAPPSKHRCTWQSISPGVRVLPRPSISSASRAERGARACAPTHATRPSSTSTPARCLTVRPSNSVTFET